MRAFFALRSLLRYPFDGHGTPLCRKATGRLKLALIPCPECKKKVSSEAETCPNCGVKISGTKAAESAVNEDAATQIGCGALLVIALIWFFWPSSGDDSKSSSQPKPAHSASGAWVICQEFVEQRLKAPASADFPWYSETYVTELGGAKYRVDSYVDAQNSFGAQIRQTFACTVRWTGGSRWRLEDMSID